jgi:hypothetical protein
MWAWRAGWVPKLRPMAVLSSARVFFSSCPSSVSSVVSVCLLHLSIARAATAVPDESKNLARLPARGGLLYFPDRVAKILDVLEVAIHRCETDIGHLVELVEFAHDHLAQAA